MAVVDGVDNSDGGLGLVMMTTTMIFKGMAGSRADFPPRRVCSDSGFREESWLDSQGRLCNACVNPYLRSAGQRCASEETADKAETNTNRTECQTSEYGCCQQRRRKQSPETKGPPEIRVVPGLGQWSQHFRICLGIHGMSMPKGWNDWTLSGLGGASRQ